LEPTPALLDPEQLEAPPPLPGPRGLYGQLEAMLDAANVPLTPQHLFGFAAALGLLLGLAGCWFAGLWLAIPAAAAGAAAPVLVLR
jgi:hypothetical protein